MTDRIQGRVTGVYSGNNLAWDMLGESYNAIDPHYNDAKREIVAELVASGIDPDDAEYTADDLYTPSDTQLWGHWRRERGTGLYYPAARCRVSPSSGYSDFAAIYDSNMNVLQVVWSIYKRYGRWASPCYPGQVDARPDDPTHPDPADGRIVPYYALPADCLYSPDR